eukprot:5941446-Prymnesium_polylepis.1
MRSGPRAAHIRSTFAGNVRIIPSWGESPRSLTVSAGPQARSTSCRRRRGTEYRAGAAAGFPMWTQPRTFPSTLPRRSPRHAMSALTPLPRCRGSSSPRFRGAVLERPPLR